MVSTRRKSYELKSSVRNEEPPLSTSESLSDRRRRWSRLLLAHHYQPVISDVLDEELPKYVNSTAVDVADRVSLSRECALILSSAPSVFARAVDGDLVQQMLVDVELKKEYAVIQERAHNQPSIYIHLLADEGGIAPTPNQYLTIRDMVLDYIAEDHLSARAWALDNITHPMVTKQVSSQGHRKYLHTTTRSSKRVETLHRFCHGVHKRWLETPITFRDKPFLYPPGECGYSKDTYVRLAQHRAHQSSNYVMNLVEDVCTYLNHIGTFEQHFRMHQFIIYLIFRPNQAALAEIFCSGLLQVWVEGGGGFNAYPAGRSVATTRRVSMGEWNGHERWAMRNSPVVENMRMQKEQAEEWRRALDWEKDASTDEAMAEVDVDGGEDDKYVVL